VFAVLKFTDDSGATVSSDDVSSGFSTEFSESSDDGSATAQEDAVTSSAMEVLATLDSGNNHSPTVEGSASSFLNLLTSTIISRGCRYVACDSRIRTVKALSLGSNRSQADLNYFSHMQLRY
jgi:hypothetical protein